MDQKINLMLWQRQNIISPKPRKSQKSHFGVRTYKKNSHETPQALVEVSLRQLCQVIPFSKVGGWKAMWSLTPGPGVHAVISKGRAQPVSNLDFM